MRCTVALWSLGCLLANGCADQQETIVVTHAPLWTDQGCIIDATIDAALLRGTLDVEWETPYLLPLVVLNNLSMNSSTNTELTNEVQITDADVRLEMPQSEDILEYVRGQGDANVEFNQVLSSISVAAGDRVGIGVEVIGRPASQAFNEALEMFLDADGQVTVVAKVVVHGERSSGSVGQVGTVEAREFTFPIELCRECLFTCSGCEGGCPAAFDGVHGGVCGNAQDLAVTPTICELPEME